MRYNGQKEEKKRYHCFKQLFFKLGYLLEDIIVLSLTRLWLFESINQIDHFVLILLTLTQRSPIRWEISRRDFAECLGRDSAEKRPPLEKGKSQRQPSRRSISDSNRNRKFGFGRDRNSNLIWTIAYKR